MVRRSLPAGVFLGGFRKLDACQDQFMYELRGSTRATHFGENQARAWVYTLLAALGANLYAILTVLPWDWVHYQTWFWAEVEP